MRDLRFSDASGDIVISDFDLDFVSGTEALAQRLAAKLRLFRGEWFLNQRAGVPWFRDVLGNKQPRGEVVRAAIRQPILSDPEVDSIQRLDVEYDGETRALSVRARILSTSGEEVDIDAGLGV